MSIREEPAIERARHDCAAVARVLVGQVLTITGADNLLARIMAK